VPAPRAALPAERIIRIQAGLKAFGNDAIEIDGVIGAQTKAAIHEFQALFGLPETGEADEAVYAKMKEIGLTN
jgi:peptidoglycan hydrolase-like protein with peptidoglycan-binding domain